VYGFGLSSLTVTLGARGIIERTSGVGFGSKVDDTKIEAICLTPRGKPIL
jgi:hypothetical protein